MSEIAPLPIDAPAWKINDHRAGGYGNKQQWLYRFGNGYGASVIQGEHTYGGPAGLYELGVIRFDSADGDDWGLTYQTPITGDVLGHLTINDVAETLVRIAALPAMEATE